MISTKLEELYSQYGIADLSFGTIHDKLGDVYEDYCVYLLSEPKNLEKAKNNILDNSLDYVIFAAILKAFGIVDCSKIKRIKATNKIPHRETHGLSKTDVIATIQYEEGISNEFAISCKQSTVSKVAFAEFDTNTICKEVGITDKTLKMLILKHQQDSSAINFTPEEKKDLKDRLAPIARRFVRWVITGSPDENPPSLIFPTVIVKFKTQKPKDRYVFDLDKGDFKYQSFKVFSIEEYIDSVMFTKNGSIKSGGFGTGLSWTYATGSKGVKIQFKA